MQNIDFDYLFFFFYFALKLILSELELYEIPDPIINLYHNRANQLDISFNKLTSIAGISLFTSLEELILDNNQLGDITFPANSNLKLLSLNNNMVRRSRKIGNINIRDMIHLISHGCNGSGLKRF